MNKKLQVLVGSTVMAVASVAPSFADTTSPQPATTATTASTTNTQLSPQDEAYVSKFKTSNKELLSKTVDTIQLSDKSAVDTLNKDLALQSAAVKEALKAEIQLLDSFSKKIAILDTVPEKAAAFKKTYAVAIAIPLNDVKAGQGFDVVPALEAYNKLDPETKKALEVEGDHLAAVMKKLQELDKQAGVTPTTNTTVNPNTTNATSTAKVDAKQDAKQDVKTDATSSESTAKPLDSTGLTPVNKFRDDFSSLLNVTGPLTESQKTLLNQALDRYDSLSLDDKNALKDEKIALDKLKKGLIGKGEHAQPKTGVTGPLVATVGLATSTIAGIALALINRKR